MAFWWHFRSLELTIAIMMPRALFLNSSELNYELCCPIYRWPIRQQQLGAIHHDVNYSRRDLNSNGRVGQRSLGFVHINRPYQWQRDHSAISMPSQPRLITIVIGFAQDVFTFASLMIFLVLLYDCMSA